MDGWKPGVPLRQDTSSQAIWSSVHFLIFNSILSHCFIYFYIYLRLNYKGILSFYINYLHPSTSRLSWLSKMPHSLSMSPQWVPPPPMPSLSYSVLGSHLGLAYGLDNNGYSSIISETTAHILLKERITTYHCDSCGVAGHTHPSRIRRPHVIWVLVVAK